MPALVAASQPLDLGRQVRVLGRQRGALRVHAPRHLARLPQLLPARGHAPLEHRLELLVRPMLVRGARLCLDELRPQPVDLLLRARVLSRRPRAELLQLHREVGILGGEARARRLGAARRLEGRAQLAMHRGGAALERSLELLARALLVRRARLRLGQPRPQAVDLRLQLGDLRLVERPPWAGARSRRPSRGREGSTTGSRRASTVGGRPAG
jgi:hypothetical protein